MYHHGMHHTPSTPLQAEPGQRRYAALATALRHRIVVGEWPPGTPLPAETHLAAEHGVALGTIRQALALLAEQGLIERRHGKGTFVRRGLAGATMLRFFRFGGDDGAMPQSRILDRQCVAASAEVARHLGIAPGEQVLWLHRLRSLRGQPCLLEEIWLPLPLFDALVDSPLEHWGDLLYPMLAERCGVIIARATDHIGFMALGAAQAHPLGLPPGHPGVTVTRQAYALSGHCVEMRVTRADAAAFHYTVTLN